MKARISDFISSPLNIVACIVLLASIVFYILGITEPLMSTKYQVLNIRIRSQEVTLFDSIEMFWQSGEFLIAGIILVFTFILPISKYIELLVRLITRKKFLAWQGVDKWNMIDVFLISMLILNFKMNSSFIVMRLEMGTNFIALAVLSRILAIVFIERMGKEKKIEKREELPQSGVFS